MDATPEQSAEGLAVVQVLSAVLDRLVLANGPIAHADPGQITKFHAMKAPGIGIQQYLERIHKYSSCSNECFIFALIYIDRLIQRSNFLLTELNVHRVVITAVLLAAKFFDDAYYNNAYYAKVGGVLVSEMNGLEVDFLFRINFSLHVPPDVFEKYRAELMLHSNPPAAVVVTPPPVPLMAPSPPPMDGRSPPGFQHHSQVQQQQQQQQPQHLDVVDAESWNMAAEVLLNATQMLQASQDPLLQEAAVRGLMVGSGAVEDVRMGGGGCGDPFFPVMQRANSLPPGAKGHHHATPTFCVARHAQPTCYPQPMGPPPPVSSGRLTFPDDPFGRIFPIQSTLVHHHHGGSHHHHHYPRAGPAEGPAYGTTQQLVGRMLAGVSGAGL